MSELRGLGAVQLALRVKGGRVLAISVDSAEDSRRVVEHQKLAFPILCDKQRELITKYGLVFARGGPDHSDIAIPAQILVAQDGRIAWRHIARRVQDRASPDEALAEIAKL